MVCKSFVSWKIEKTRDIMMKLKAVLFKGNYELILNLKPATHKKKKELEYEACLTLCCIISYLATHCKPTSFWSSQRKILPDVGLQLLNRMKTDFFSKTIQNNTQHMIEHCLEAR